MNLQLEIVRDIDAVPGLAEKWDGLLQRSNANTLFLTYEWIRNWWKTYHESRELLIIIAKENNQYIGIAPLYVETSSFLGGFPLKQICLLGDKYVASCFLDFIIQKDKVSSVLPFFLEYLTREVDWDRLFLNRIHETSPSFDLLNDGACKSRNLGIHAKTVYVCPFQALPATIQEFMKQPDTTFKKIAYTRHLKKLYKNYRVEFIAQTPPYEIDASLDIFIKLHNERWNWTKKKGFFDFEGTTQFYRNLCHDLAQKGALRLSALKIDGQIQAMECGIVYANDYYAHQLACGLQGRTLRAGTVLSYKIFESLIGHIRTFHYLEGPESYKYLWGCRNQFLKQLEVSRTLKGKFVSGIRKTRDRLVGGQNAKR